MTAVLNLDTAVAFLTPVLVVAARRRGRTRPFLYLAVFLANGASLLLPGSNLTNLIVLGGRPPRAPRSPPAWRCRGWSPSSAWPGWWPSGGTARWRAPPPPSPRWCEAGRTRVGGGAGRGGGRGGPPAPLGGGRGGRHRCDRRRLGRRRAPAHPGRRRAGGEPPGAGRPLLGGRGPRGPRAGVVVAGPPGEPRLGPWGHRARRGGDLGGGQQPPGGLAPLRPAARPPLRPLLLGLDLGPDLAVTGALSAVLWLQVAHQAGASPSAVRYSRLGVVVTAVSLAAALAVMVAAN